MANCFFERDHSLAACRNSFSMDVSNSAGSSELRVTITPRSKKVCKGYSRKPEINPLQRCCWGKPRAECRGLSEARILLGRGLLRGHGQCVRLLTTRQPGARFQVQRFP